MLDFLNNIHHEEKMAIKNGTCKWAFIIAMHSTDTHTWHFVFASKEPTTLAWLHIYVITYYTMPVLTPILCLRLVELLTKYMKHKQKLQDKKIKKLIL